MELKFRDVASGTVCGRSNLLSEISEDLRIAEHLVRRNARNNKVFKQGFEKSWTKPELMSQSCEILFTGHDVAPSWKFNQQVEQIKEFSY